MNLHLGQAPDFAVYEEAPGGWKYLETRPAPATGGGDRRWYALAEVLEDCAAVFTGGAGDRPLTVLGEAGIEVYTVEGLIDDLLGAWGRGGNLGVYLKREVHACGDGCRGTGTGCG